MTRLCVVGFSVLLGGAVVLCQPQGQAVPPVKLQAGKAILQKGERLILPKGTAVSAEQVKGEAELHVSSLRLIPAQKDQWEFEIRPVGGKPLRIKPERDALKGVEVIFAGKKGELTHDTTLGGGFTWLSQPYEIRDRTGKVLFTTGAKGQ